MGKKQKKDEAYTASRTIAMLRRELNKERRHSAALERENASLKQELRQSGDSVRSRRQKHADPRVVAIEKMRDAASRRAHHYRRNSYVRYIFESMMESLPIRIISRVLTYMRRFRLIQYIALILTTISTIAVVAVVSAALLPFLLAGTAILVLGVCLRSRQVNRIMRNELKGRHLRVFFPPRKSWWAQDSFFMRQARNMATERGVAVVIVSPYSLSRRGAGKKRFFITANKVDENLYIVRRNYFFIFRKRVMDVIDPDATVIY